MSLYLDPKENPAERILRLDEFKRGLDAEIAKAKRAQVKVSLEEMKEALRLLVAGTAPLRIRQDPLAVSFVTWQTTAEPRVELTGVYEGFQGLTIRIEGSVWVPSSKDSIKATLSLLMFGFGSTEPAEMEGQFDREEKRWTWTPYYDDPDYQSPEEIAESLRVEDE